MTNHPLTDKMCESICQNECDTFASQNEIWFQSMRAAADWQLKQVIEWCIYSAFENDDDLHIQWKAIDALKKAMRPQEDNS